MTDATAWPELLRLALLGTRQSAGTVPALPELPAPPDAPAEARVLHAAGALGLLRKAGYRPPVAAAAPPAPAPPETRPALGRRGTDALRQLLDSRYPDLLPDYQAALARHQRRVPHRLLVPLLDVAAPRPELRPLTAAVLGARGAWLAAHNPAWAALLAASADEAVWETGTPAQRQQYLSALRRPDAAQARELLAAALPQEPARQQAQLLATLAEQLSPDDERVLTAYLASKSKEVRQTVAPLLARLPGSALADRLWQRAQAYLTLKKPLLGATRLEVTLPKAWDPAWQAEGIEAKDARFIGEKAAWLGQLLALIPPQRWAEHWRLSPDKLLALAAEGEWAGLLLPAWREALRLHRAPDWAAAYLTLQLNRPTAVPALPAEAAAQLLPPADLHALLLRELPAQPRLTQPEAAWEPLLLAAPAPWPAALTERTLRLIDNTVTVPANARYLLNYRLQTLLRHMQRVVPPGQYALCATALQALSEAEPALTPAFNHFLDALQFRQELTDTLTEPPAPDG